MAYPPLPTPVVPLGAVVVVVGVVVVVVLAVVVVVGADVVLVGDDSPPVDAAGAGADPVDAVGPADAPAAATAGPGDLDTGTEGGATLGAFTVGVNPLGPGAGPALGLGAAPVAGPAGTVVVAGWVAANSPFSLATRATAPITTAAPTTQMVPRNRPTLLLRGNGIGGTTATGAVIGPLRPPVPTGVVIGPVGSPPDLTAHCGAVTLAWLGCCLVRTCLPECSSRNSSRYSQLPRSCARRSG